MKSSTLRSVILALTAVVICLTSCKKNTTSEVKINDFASLSSLFAEPPREYTTSPFFVWNAEITREEIDHFMNDFKNSGSRQVFIHPRPGLITEYLSDEWFELFQYTVEKGKELDMNVWIYDENSYPSGFAGGHVPAEMPESYIHGQGLRMTRFELLPDTAEKYFLCLKEENGAFSDITSSLSNEKGKKGNYFLFSKSYNGKSDWYGGFSYVDLLYPGVTQKFIEITMTGYEKSSGSEFGKAIPGTFSDEPQINSPGGIRWTPDLFEVFEKKWGYDLKQNLPSLYEDTGDYKRIRHNYTQTLLQLFIDRWSKPWYEYCEEKGLKFTGHYWEHEWPNMRPGGDNMAMYAWHQVPGIDMLFNQWNDSTPRAQFGNIRSVKELASAANQTGRQRKLSETYGGSGWEITFTDLKRNGDWEYALGVNLMNQHLSHFTLQGARKYDYPVSFTYHEPWWDNYKYLNDHYARLSLALSSGRQLNDILVLEPTTTAWLYDSYAKRNPKVTEIGQAFQAFVTKLEKNQVEYDLGSENIIKDRGSVKDGKFIVGQCSYSKVVIPPLTENLDISTFRLLKKFVKEGGTIIAFSIPTLVDGSEDEELMTLFETNAEKIIFRDELSGDFISEHLSAPDIAFTGISGGVLYHHRRIMEDGQLLFLVNSNLAETLYGGIKTDGKNVVEMNTLTGDINGYPYETDGNKLNLAFTIPPAGSLLLYIPSNDEFDFDVPPKALNLIPLQSYLPMIITRDEDNVLTIDFCDVQVGEEVTQDLQTYDAADKVYKYHGFTNGNPWNTSVQYKTRTVDRDTFGIESGFIATFHFEVRGVSDFSSFRAVIERPQLWTATVNGTGVTANEGEWWLDRSFGVYDISQLVRNGDNIITLTVSPMKVNAEIEPVYILGDFSVEPASKGWIITAKKEKYTTGSWKVQGLPFYSWGITYSKEFNIENPEGIYEVGLREWNGTIAEVNVNSQPAQVIAFPPYCTDVTRLIKTGINKIDVKVTGSLKNLLGPHHNNPAPGMVSPRHWRNVKSYPPGKDYQLIDYGLFEEFILMQGK
jgi:hypothetical protein